MNRLPIILIAFLVLCNLYSCGPSAAEQAQMQQRRDDSIKNATEHKFAMQNEIKDDAQKLINLRGALENSKATLEAENDRMNNVKGFKLFRTTDEREQQIKAQSLKIQSIKDNIAALEQNINQIQDRMSAIKVEMQKYQ